MHPVFTDQVEKGLNRQLDVFSNAENFNKLIQIFLEESNELEQTAIDYARTKDLYTAEGYWLDVLGNLLNISRNGDNDEDYRARLFQKIGRNVADGTPNVIIELVKNHTQAASVRLSQHTLNCIQIYTNGTQRVDGSLITLLDDITPVTCRSIALLDYYDNAFQPAFEQKLGGYYEPSVGRHIPAFTNSTELIPDVIFDPDAEAGDLIVLQAIDDYVLQASDDYVLYAGVSPRPWCWEVWDKSKSPVNEVLQSSLDDYVLQASDDWVLMSGQ